MNALSNSGVSSGGNGAEEGDIGFDGLDTGAATGGLFEEDDTRVNKSAALMPKSWRNVRLLPDLNMLDTLVNSRSKSSKFSIIFVGSRETKAMQSGRT